MRLIDADALKEYIHNQDGRPFIGITIGEAFQMMVDEQPTIEERKWIPCSERKPKINQIILLSTNMGNVYVGRRGKPDIIWQVTESDGSKLWVYDPEAYTDDIDSLPKSEDYSFYGVDDYLSWESVSSVNYDDKFEGIIAWMSLPEPYREEATDETP